MIFGNITQGGTYGFLPQAIKEHFEYALAHDLLGFGRGSHPIDGGRLFVNIIEYETAVPEERFWEAYRKYLDIHLMLDGQGQIDLGFIKNMKQKDFVQKDDFLSLKGEPDSYAVLRPGDFLICYPHDGHRTVMAVDGPKQIGKVILKARTNN